MGRKLSEEAAQTNASLKSDRMAQLQTVYSGHTEAILATIRGAHEVPAPEYHLQKHGGMLGVLTVEEYQDAFRDHVQKEYLRVFTYLRQADRTPFWELVDPSTGTTAVYNEGNGMVSSFFRPKSTERRMAIAQDWWIEVIQTTRGWEPKENWQWE